MRSSSIDRPRRAAGALAAAALFAGCGLDTLEVEIEEQTTVEAASLPEQLIGDIGFAGFSDFDITESQTFQNEGYTEDDIDSVYMRSFDLRIARPSGATFDFLNRIRFTAKAEGQPDVDIAWIDPIPEGQRQVELEVDPNVDLQPYVVAPQMTIETSANGNRPPEETTIEARIVFDVDVNAL